LSAVLDLLLSDARTPTGGYAHSGGLEALLAADHEDADIQAFMRGRLHTVGHLDAAFAAAACAEPALDSLLELEAEWAARTPAEPLRRAARALGRGLLRTACLWFDDASALIDYHDAGELTPRPVVLGAVAAHGGSTPRAAARASLYDDAASVASAAVKLRALDAAQTSRWILSLAADIEGLAAEAAGGSAVPAELPSPAAPRLERLALTHATIERRLFAS
jgi:urease accessory protein